MPANEMPSPGEMVVLKEIPVGLLDDLPADDRSAISEIIGKAVRLHEYDSYGRAELEFTDAKGVIHFICVDVSAIRPLTTDH